MCPGGQRMLKALVVEDEEDIKQLLAEELRAKGYEVWEASDGEIAMRRVGEQIPDIIFVDIWMPVMDGFDLISKLRENSQTAGIPVVLVTAMNARNAEGKARELGVKHHLTKPWESWALDFVLNQALETKGRGPKDEAKYQVFPPKVIGSSNSTNGLGG